MGFKGLQILNRCSKPINPVDITHIVDISSEVTVVNTLLPRMLNVVTIITISIAVGIALLRTCFKNEPFTRWLLGSSASMNEGIPIHMPLIRVNCMGTNGYCNASIINTKSNNIE